MDDAHSSLQTAEEVREELLAAPRSARGVVDPGAAIIPSGPGLYAWWAGPETLPSLPAPDHPSRPLRLLYVGISSDLEHRIRRQHLRANTGSSTFRLTLAAHLLTDGGLSPFRQGTKILIPPNDLAWLLDWQLRHLYVSWVPRLDPRDVEAAVIAAMKPPFNGDDNQSHVYRRQLRETRAAFRRAAECG